MRLLVLNPNTSVGVTDRIREAADAVALPGEALTTVCPATGPELIVTEEDADAARQAVVETVRALEVQYDGIILASFGNTGARAVRALRKNTPVIGIAGAAFSTARALGGAFGIVTFAEGLVPALRAKAQEAGLGDALTGIAHLSEKDFGDPATVQFRYETQLAELCQKMARDGATSIVMGGGPLAGLAPRLAPACSVPLIDGTQSAIGLMRAVIPGRQATASVAPMEPLIP